MQETVYPRLPLMPCHGRKIQVTNVMSLRLSQEVTILALLLLGGTSQEGTNIFLLHNT